MKIIENNGRNYYSFSFSVFVFYFGLYFQRRYVFYYGRSSAPLRPFIFIILCLTLSTFIFIFIFDRTPAHWKRKKKNKKKNKEGGGREKLSEAKVKIDRIMIIVGAFIFAVIEKE